MSRSFGQVSYGQTKKSNSSPSNAVRWVLRCGRNGWLTLRSAFWDWKIHCAFSLRSWCLAEREVGLGSLGTPLVNGLPLGKPDPLASFGQKRGVFHQCFSAAFMASILKRAMESHSLAKMINKEEGWSRVALWPSSRFSLLETGFLRRMSRLMLNLWVGYSPAQKGEGGGVQKELPLQMAWWNPMLIWEVSLFYANQGSFGQSPMQSN